MAQKVVSMEAKLAAVLSMPLKGVRVVELCEQLGITRQTFYKYRRRFQAEGPAGLVERSRRPHRSPGMIGPELEDEIVRLRKTLPLDRGAATIGYHLARSGWPVPSVATIHRALRRRGLVIDQPQKRPRSSWKRFEWPRPNDAWQIDATRWVLMSGKEAWIMDVLDDHSRVVVAARTAAGPTSMSAWNALCEGAQGWGLPAHLMSDNGTCFTTRFQKERAETDFERDLRHLGVHHICSSPNHPQTCGKIERFHQTLKRWLRTQPQARTYAQLDRQLDRFLIYYNEQRPHRALGGATPTERWHASTPATPGPPIDGPTHASRHLVASTGAVKWRHFNIGLGAEHARKQVLVISRGDDIAVFDDQRLIRRLTLDPTRRFQGTGKPPGRRPKTNNPKS
jgi:transposase InsO family protein